MTSKGEKERSHGLELDGHIIDTEKGKKGVRFRIGRNSTSSESPAKTLPAKKRETVLYSRRNCLTKIRNRKEHRPENLEF